MKKSALLSSVFLTVLPGAAMAQSIDYGSLQELFGEPVTTSATGAPQRSTDAPATMEIITSEQIRSSGQTDLPGILAQVSGVNVQRLSRTTAEVAVRGYNQSFSPRLLVLVNGRQVYLDFYGLTNWDAIPVQLEEIRQIEIVKGPNTALFGFNAVGGVVNIITFDPLFDDVSTVNVRVDHNADVQGSLVKSFSANDRLFGRLSVGGYQAKEFDDIIDAPSYSGPEEKDRLSAAAELKFKFADSVVGTFETTYSDADRYVQLPVLNLTQNSRIILDSYRGAIDADGNWGLFRAEAYYNGMDRRQLTPTGEEQPSFETDLLVISAENTKKIGTDHTVRIAGEYRKNELTSAAFNEEYEVLSGSAMWNWAINGDVTSTVAVRVDNLRADEDSSEVSYNAGLVWKPSSAGTVRVQAARGVQVPSLVEQGAAQATLDPTITDNYSIDYDRTISAIKGMMRVSFFYQENSDYRAFARIPGFQPPTNGQPVSPILFTTPQNIADSTIHGFEASVRGRLTDQLGWETSYTYLSAEDDFNPIFEATNTPVQEIAPTIPESELKAALDYKGERWAFRGAARHVSDYEFADVSQPDLLKDIDAYTALDLSVGYKVKDGVVVSLDGQDLTNDGDLQATNGAVERRAQLSLTYDF